MTSSYRALCTDFYVNLKLGLKLDLPRKREEVLEMFERGKHGLAYDVIGNGRRPSACCRIAVDTVCVALIDQTKVAPVR